MRVEVRKKKLENISSRPETFWMGILNLTPDSFSDGGRFVSLEAARKRASEMIEAGASIIDVGAVSTRPGALPVESAEEIERLERVLEMLQSVCENKILISLDSSEPQVVEYFARKQNIDIVNDVYGSKKEFHGKNTAHLAAQYKLGLITMHMQGDPQTMQNNPAYSDVVEDVFGELQTQIRMAQNMGVSWIAVDPGIGFGKTVADNLALLSEQGIKRLCDLRVPVLIGLSRKRFLQKVFAEKNEHGNLEIPHHRDRVTKVMENEAIRWGAKIIRTHRLPNEGFENEE